MRRCFKQRTLKWNKMLRTWNEGTKNTCDRKRQRILHEIKNSKLSYRARKKESANNNDSYPNKQILWVESKHKSDLNATNGI